MSSPARHLSGAAELVREFNHDSRVTRADWEFPGASYDALGALSRLVGMLPQAIDQTAVPVLHTHKHGRLLIDGGDADEAVKHMRTALDTAMQAARFLSAAVDHLHSTTSPMGLDTRGLPEFEE
ncbi:hypothetical protein [Streptomyces bullii]|uniref:Uncharacterized protein n=1 Tax=Streptomyces bullii TaxID=349910 RepID=A0ABW0UQS4_9ACTN